MKHYVALLRGNSNFRDLWLAQSISQLGDWFNMIALSTLVSDYSDGSGLAISLFLLARFLPPVLVGPLAGVALDRFNRQRLLIASDVARVFIVAGFLLAISPGLLWLIYVLTVLQFTVSAVFEPGRSAITPAIVSQDKLVEANMLGSVTWSVMSAVGGALGGLVAGLFGVRTAFVIDAMTFALSALLITRLNVDSSVLRPDPDHVGRGRPLAEFMEAVRFARKTPAVGATLFVKAGTTVGSLNTLMIIYATSFFVLGDKGAGSLGIFWASFGLGSIVAPVVFERFNDGTLTRQRYLILAGFVCATAGWLLFSGAGSLAMVALAIGVKALGSTNWPYSAAILQKLTPDRYLGRIFSLDQIAFQGTMAVGILLTGITVDMIGTDHVRSVALATAVMSVFPLAYWARAMRVFDQRSEAEPVQSGAR